MRTWSPIHVTENPGLPLQAEASRTQVGCVQRRAGRRSVCTSLAPWKARKWHSHVGSMCPWQQGHRQIAGPGRVLTSQVGLCSSNQEKLKNKEATVQGICSERQGPGLGLTSGVTAWAPAPDSLLHPLAVPSSGPGQTSHLTWELAGRS